MLTNVDQKFKILFDFVDETRGEETATPTKESEYLFVPGPEKPFDENWFINDDNKVNFTLVYIRRFDECL